MGLINLLNFDVCQWLPCFFFSFRESHPVSVKALTTYKSCKSQNHQQGCLDLRFRDGWLKSSLVLEEHSPPTSVVHEYNHKHMITSCGVAIYIHIGHYSVDGTYNVRHYWPPFHIEYGVPWDFPPNLKSNPPPSPIDSLTLPYTLYYFPTPMQVLHLHVHVC